MVIGARVARVIGARVTCALKTVCPATSTVAIGRVAVPAGVCAKMAAQFNTFAPPSKSRERLDYSTTL